MSLARAMTAFVGVGPAVWRRGAADARRLGGARSAWVGAAAQPAGVSAFPGGRPGRRGTAAAAAVRPLRSRAAPTASGGDGAPTPSPNGDPPAATAGTVAAAAAAAAAITPPHAGEHKTLTTPLYYVNAPPHMGSAYPTMAVDALARFYRLAGATTTFVTGVDEHGEKIAAAAAAAGRAPQAHCDAVSATFRELWAALDIQPDVFVRTTGAAHGAVVAQFMERVWAAGYIYKSAYAGLYCTGCEEYKDPKDLTGGTVCPTHQTACAERSEENYFFRLTAFQERLEAFHAANPEFVAPAERRNEVLGWVKAGLRDFSVSRASNPWGIPVPRDDAQTVYVWFDALLGYLSGLLREGDAHDLDVALSRGWPPAVHVIGKDILRFHAVYWPAMLMAAGLPDSALPAAVYGHGFLTKDGLKMGKSLGNTIEPAALVTAYGPDAVRYYFLRGVDFGRDGDFSASRFVEVVNADLANVLGNLLNRSTSLLRKYAGGVTPLAAADALPADHPVVVTAAAATAAAAAAYAQLDFMGAATALLGLATAANGHVDAVAPWAALKAEPGTDRHADGLAACVAALEVARIVGLGLSPITPGLATRIYAALGRDAADLAAARWGPDTR